MLAVQPIAEAMLAAITTVTNREVFDMNAPGRATRARRVAGGRGGCVGARRRAQRKSAADFRTALDSPDCCGGAQTKLEGDVNGDAVAIAFAVVLATPVIAKHVPAT